MDRSRIRQEELKKIKEIQKKRKRKRWGVLTRKKRYNSSSESSDDSYTANFKKRKRKRKTNSNSDNSDDVARNQDLQERDALDEADRGDLNQDLQEHDERDDAGDVAQNQEYDDRDEADGGDRNQDLQEHDARDVAGDEDRNQEHNDRDEADGGDRNQDLQELDARDVAGDGDWNNDHYEANFDEETHIENDEQSIESDNHAVLLDNDTHSESLSSENETFINETRNNLPSNDESDTDNQNQGERNQRRIPQINSTMDLAIMWVLCHLGRQCSNEVSNEYFSLAWDLAEVIVQLKRSSNGKKPDLRNFRQKINRELLGGIKSDYFYHDLSLDEDERQNNEIQVFNMDKMPKKKYPPDKYELLGQITKIQPSEVVKFHKKIHEDHENLSGEILMSIDGVNETQSTSRSLEIISIQFVECSEVYPVLILRPEVYMKKYMKSQFEAYISNLLEELQEENLTVKKLIMDAPERASIRKQKAHGGYFSCDLCLANPINIQIDGKRGSKRVFTKDMRNCERRCHEQSLQWANEVESGEYIENFGIIGKSIFFNLPYFDIVKDIPPEPMHLIDGGLVKNTCGRTFKHGSSAQTRVGYKRAPIGKLSQMIRQTKFPSDFPRRSRPYDHPSYKCHEWRQILLFLFPLIVKSLGSSHSNEKAVFISLGFMNRATKMPEDEFQNIPMHMFEHASDLLNHHYEIAYGKTAGTYNFHLVGSHLLEIRDQHPLTEYTAYAFEGSYSNVRKAFTSGTPNICKQIMQRIFLQKIRKHANCKNQMKPIRPSAQNTAKTRDDLVYTYEGEEYQIYRVLDVINDDQLEATELDIQRKIFSRTPALDFGYVGMFQNNGALPGKVILRTENVRGKVIFNKGLLITVPKNILVEI